MPDRSAQRCVLVFCADGGKSEMKVRLSAVSERAAKIMPVCLPVVLAGGDAGKNEFYRRFSAQPALPVVNMRQF